MKLKESKLRKIIREELSSLVEQVESQNVLQSLRRFELERKSSRGVTSTQNRPVSVGVDENPYNETVQYWALFRDWGKWKDRGRITRDSLKEAIQAMKDFASRQPWSKHVKDVFANDRKHHELFVYVEFNKEDVENFEDRGPIQIKR